MKKLQEFLCKIGFHPEEELCLELDSPCYLGQQRILRLKCNACGKVFQTHKVESCLNIKAWR